MGGLARLSRRAFIGLGLASLPAVALARRAAGLPRSQGEARRAYSSAALAVPYSPAYGARPVAVLAQLHDHTTDSDGAKTPAEAVALYRAAGYGALAITDHDVVCDQPTGIAVPIVGCEQSPRTGHVGGIGTAYLRGETTDTQAIVDGIVQGGGLAILNHPSWVIGYSDEQVASLKGYVGIEIHNAACVGLRPHYRGFAVDRWDKVLTDVRPDVWGFATDDFHKIEYWRGYDVGRTIVFARSAKWPDILDSLVKGCFVADVSNFGVTPGYPSVSPERRKGNVPGRRRTALRRSRRQASCRVSRGVGRVRLPWVREVRSDRGRRRLRRGLRHRPRLEQSLGRGGGRRAGVERGRRHPPPGERHAGPEHAWLKRHLHGDLEARVDSRIDHAPSEGERPSAGVEFHTTSGGYGYALAPDFERHALTLYRVDDGVPVRLHTSAAFFPSAGEWYSIRLKYTHATGRIQARGWRRGNSEPTTWQIDVRDGTYTEGSVCLRASYAASFDNLYVRGFKTYYQPIPVTPS